MSKIAIIIAANLNYTPFYYRYEKVFSNMKIDYDLIIWNRAGIKTDSLATNIFEYELSDEANNGDWKKAWKFVQFSRYAKKVIKKNKYKYLFFLGTNSGNAVFLAHFLNRYYNNRFWVDVRDYTYEWFKPFCYLEKKAVLAADTVVISSRGFLSFLPENREYVVAHNIDWDSINKAKQLPSVHTNNKIRIGFIGNMRYFQENYKVIDLFGNDDRFILMYYGTGCQTLKKYCNKHNIKNVRFKGRFDRSETAALYMETDFVNNLYGNDQTYLKLALSNKFYYALFLKKPILVCEGTYMEKLANEGGIGFTVKYDDVSIKDKVIDFFYSFDTSNQKILDLQTKINLEDQEFVESIQACIKKIR